MRTVRYLTALALVAIVAGCSSQRQAQLAGSDDLYGSGGRRVTTVTTTTTTEYVSNAPYTPAPAVQAPMQQPAQQQAPQTSYYEQQPATTTTTQGTNGTTYVTNNYYGTGFDNGLAYTSPIGYYRPWYRPGFSIGIGYNSFIGFSPVISYGLASPYWGDPFWYTPGLYNPYFSYGYGFRPFGYDPFWGPRYNPFFASPWSCNPYYNPYFGYAYGYGYNWGYNPYNPYNPYGPNPFYNPVNNGNGNGNDGGRPPRVVPTVVRGPVARPGSSYGRPGQGGTSTGDGIISRRPGTNGNGVRGRVGVDETPNNPGVVPTSTGNRIQPGPPVPAGRPEVYTAAPTNNTIRPARLETPSTVNPTPVRGNRLETAPQPVQPNQPNNYAPARQPGNRVEPAPQPQQPNNYAPERQPGNRIESNPTPAPAPRPSVSPTPGPRMSTGMPAGNVAPNAVVPNTSSAPSLNTSPSLAPNAVAPAPRNYYTPRVASPQQQAPSQYDPGNSRQRFEAPSRQQNFTPSRGSGSSFGGGNSGGGSRPSGGTSRPGPR